MRTWFRRQVLSRPWLCFVVLTASFGIFGTGTLNLFFLLQANLTLLLEHGWFAAMEGGLAQLAEIIATGVIGMFAYIVFKTCEHQLVHWLSDKEQAE
jgi:hypothetical protein